MQEEARLALLNQILSHSRSAPFYNRRLPGKPLTSLSEIKQIPLTTKEDLRQCSPFGLICVPREELYQYHESYGTTGAPISTWYTEEDLLHQAELVNAGGLKFTSSDTVLIRFPYALSSIAHFVQKAAQMKHACVIPASSRTIVTPFTRVVDLLLKLEVTVLAGLPLQAVLVAETAELLGLKPAEDFPNLRAIFTAGEPLTHGKRRLLESIWGVPVIDNYGMTETGSLLTHCQYNQHHPEEDYYFLELLADDLRNEVKKGEPGNLVVTTFQKKAAPMIRYLTGDRVKMVNQQCKCGKEFSLVVLGRKQDTINIGDRVLDLWDLEEIISHFPCRRFWVAGSGPNGLKFIVEEEKAGDHINTELVHYLEERYELPIDVETVPKGTLYDRKELLAVGEVGKPRYIYSGEEMKVKAYLKSTKM